MPITETIKIMKEEKKSYPPLPEDIYTVELLDITSKQAETYNSKKGDTDKKEFETLLQFQYTLLEGEDGEEKLRGRNVWDNFVPASLYIGKNGKNKLYKIVEAFLGRELTLEEEAMGIDSDFLNDLIGKQARIGIKNKPSKDGSKVYSNADAFYAPKGKFDPLTDEEKEEARVKDKKDDTTQVEEITEDDIPDF